MTADQAIRPKLDAVEWLRHQQIALDVGGASKDRRPEQAANELEGARKAFRSLRHAIEQEGYEVLHNIADGTYTVQRKPEF